MAIKVVDFFSGCGGTSAGLQAAGMEILVGIDIDQDASETFRKNFPKADFIQKDIRKLYSSALSQLIPSDRKFPLLFSACAPCQPFTKQNTSTKESDPRNTLLDANAACEMLFLRRDFRLLKATWRGTTNVQLDPTVGFKWSDRDTPRSCRQPSFATQDGPSAVS